MSYKVKTRSAAKKRFRKVAGGSKIKRAHAFHRHLMTKKTQKQKRNHRQGTYVSDADFKQISRLLPYA